MRKKQNISWKYFISLLCSFILLLGGSLAVAATYDVSGTAANPACEIGYTAGDTTQFQFQLVLHDVGANLADVEFQFPTDYYNVLSATSSTGNSSGTPSQNVVTFSQITGGGVATPQDVTITFMLQGKSRTATDGYITSGQGIQVRYGNGQTSRMVNTKVIVYPAPIDLNQSTMKVSYDYYDPIHKITDASGEYGIATVTVNVKDAFDNATNVLNGKKLYLVARGSTADRLAKISLVESTPTLNEISATTYYRLDALPSNGEVNFRVKGKLNTTYTFYLFASATDYTNTSALFGAMQSGGKNTALNFALAKLSVQGIGTTSHNEGQIKMDLDMPYYNLTGKLVEVELPSAILTKSTKDNGRVDLAPGTSLYVDIQTVQGANLYAYYNGFDFKLYIDGKEYALTDYSQCSVEVKPANLTIDIENELAFRHQASETPPSVLKLSIEGIDASQVDMLDVYLPTGTNSGIHFTPTAGIAVNADGSRATIIKHFSSEENTLELPIAFTAGAGVLTTGFDELYAASAGKAIKVYTYKSQDRNQKVEQNEDVALRYRITDAIIMASKTVFSTPIVTAQSDGNCVTNIAVDLKDNSGNASTELNGRGLYVWITDEYGNVANIKDRFDISLTGSSAETMKLINTELAASEGSSRGNRNMFRIHNIGDDTSTSSILSSPTQLNVSHLDFQIKSAVTGKFYLNIGTGRTASETLHQSASQGISTHGKSEGFTFVSKRDMPTITIGVDGDIYYNYGDAALAAPGPGQVTVEMDNVRFDENGPDYIYIQLPAGIQFTGPYHKYANGHNYLVLDKSHVTATGSTHYKLSLPIASIVGITSPVEFTSEMFIYYRGDSFDNKQALPADLEATISLKKFVKNLNIFMNASVAGPILKETTAPIQITKKTTGFNSDDFNTSLGMVLWFSTKTATPEIIAPEDIIISQNGTPITAESTKRYKIAWTGGPGVCEGLTVSFKNPGDYQLNVVLYKDSVDAPYYGFGTSLTDITVSHTETSLFSELTVIEEEPTEPTQEETDTYTLALKVDGVSYASTNHDFGIVTGKKTNTEIVVSGTLLKKSDGTPISGNVTAIGSAWTFEGNQTTTLDTSGNFRYTITSSKTGGQALQLQFTGDVTATYKINIVLSSEGSVTPSTKQFTLRKVHATDPAAVYEKAAIYLDVYDENYKKIKVTSTSEAQSYISKLVLNGPSRSSLDDTDVYVRVRSEGIEVYFTPDREGSYDVIVYSSASEQQTIRTSFDVVYQSTIIGARLTYPEDTLGIGKTSSPATIMVYDKYDAEAERIWTASDWDYYYTGNAVSGVDEWGRVTIRNNDDYIGSSVTMTVINSRLGLTASWTFQIEESSSSSTSTDTSLQGVVSGIICPDDVGLVGETNQYQFYLNDKQGFMIQLSEGQMSTSNGAKASVSISGRPSGSTVNAYISDNAQTMEKNGYGYLYVTCSKKGTVRLNITLKVYNKDRTNNNRYKYYDTYYKTVSIEFKENAKAANALTQDPTTVAEKKGYDTTVAIFLGTKQYRVNMQEKNGDAAPIMKNGKMMVPLRTVGEALGIQVEYDSANQEIQMINGKNKLYATIGSNIIRSNSGNYYSDAAPMVIDGRTYMPLRAVADALNCNIEAVFDIKGNTVGAIFMK